MFNSTKSTRRELFSRAAGGAIMAIATSAVWDAPANSNKRASNAGIPDDTNGNGLNLLTNPQCMVGAKYRMGRFIGRGADPAAAEAVFSGLQNLDPIPWVAAWTRLAEPWEQKAVQFEKQ